MRKRFLVFFLLLMVRFNSYCQITGLPTLQDESLLKTDISSQLQQQYFQTDKFPSSPIIIDSLYYLGAGDILSVLILPVSVKPELVRVGPDGMIMIPRYGTIDLKNTTLKEAKALIENFIKKQNENASVSISLFQPRTIMVRINGAVLNPGTYSLPATYRVSDAIFFANQMNVDKTLPPNLLMNFYYNEGWKNELRREINSNGLPENGYYANRNISLFNVNYGSKNLDLELSSSRKDFRLNPYLREGDEIFVPYEPNQFEKVSIAGAVVRPGKFPYKPGDKLSDLLNFGLGFRNNADLSNIFYVLDDEKTKIEVDSNLKILGNDFEIKPNSTLIVGEKYERANSTYGIVKVDGMVEKPGFYTIEIGKTKLSDILNQCGLLLPGADIGRSYILREKLADVFFPDPNVRFGKYFSHSNLTMEDSMRFRIDVNYRREYVSCNFLELLQGKSTKNNVLLQDGDLIVIPKSSKSVFVWGQVKNPGFVPFSEGKDYRWYIEEAGGYLPTANPKRTRIIRGIQKIWLPPNGVTLLAGDEIYVPRNPDMPPGIEVQYYSLIATGVATLISLTYLIINLTRRN